MDWGLPSKVRNVINIGIGGSDLGPVMAYEALKHYSDRDMTFRFVSNVDGSDFAEATSDLDAERLCLSFRPRRFTTLENDDQCLLTARVWALEFLTLSAAITKHLWQCRQTRRKWRSSVSLQRNMFGFWDWVGGRYSGVDAANRIGHHAGDWSGGRLSRNARRFSPDGRTLQDGAILRTIFQCCSVWLGLWYTDALRMRRRWPYCLTEQYLKRFPALSSSATDDGE